MTQRLLIAGCGYVGCALGAKLLAGPASTSDEPPPWQVWGLRRNVAELPPGVEAVPADLQDPEALASALAPLPPLDAVVYGASAASSAVEDYRRAYVLGLRNLLKVLEARDQRPHLLYISSTGVYGQVEAEEVDEDSETTPRRAAAEELLAGEALAREAPGGATIVRLSGIYGPGRSRLIRQIRAGRARLTRAPLWTNRIHLDDCAGCLAFLLDRRRQAPLPHDLYLASDAEPAERNDVYRWIAAELGTAEPALEEPAARQSGRIVGANKRCHSGRLRSLGYRFNYPSYREGYGALLALGTPSENA